MISMDRDREQDDVIEALYKKVVSLCVKFIVKHDTYTYIFGGVILNKSELIATNGKRLIKKCKRFRCILGMQPNIRYKVRVIDRDPDSNITLVQLFSNSLLNLLYAEFSKMRNIGVGMRVLSITHHSSHFILLKGYISYPFIQVEHRNVRTVCMPKRDIDGEDSESEMDEEDGDNGSYNDERTSLCYRCFNVPRFMADPLPLIKIGDLHGAGAAGSLVFNLNGELLRIHVFTPHQIDYVVSSRALQLFLHTRENSGSTSKRYLIE